jgi:hypothetical protein
MFDAGCNPEEYQRQDKSYPFPDLAEELCPHCRSALLKKHGFYTRWLCDIAFNGDILIRRFICKACGKTVSLLPSFAHPRASYGIAFIIAVFHLFYLDEMSVTQVVKAFRDNKGHHCSRQLLRQFRIRLKENLNRLIMEVIALLRLKSPPVTVPMGEKKKRARQFLECIYSFDPKDVLLKLFERSGITLLAALAR